MVNATCKVHHLAFHNAFSPRFNYSPAVWCRVFQSCVFRPCIFYHPAFSSLAFSVPSFTVCWRIRRIPKYCIRAKINIFYCNNFTIQFIIFFRCDTAAMHWGLKSKFGPFYFCDNFSSCKPIQIIFGINIADKIRNTLICRNFDFFCYASLVYIVYSDDVRTASTVQRERHSSQEYQPFLSPVGEQE